MPIILMADIVKSSRRNAKALMKSFADAVGRVNRQHHRQIISPLTITLGDEFQGIIRNVPTALQLIFDLEELGMTANTPFQLRYVLLEGEIETKINTVKAHAMLGPGLTEARERLLAMKTSRSRFHVKIKDESRTEDLNLMFIILQGIEDQWTDAQKKIVPAFLKFDDYRKVAAQLKKDPSAAWKRRKSLMITEYNALQRLMMKTAGVS